MRATHAIGAVRVIAAGARLQEIRVKITTPITVADIMTLTMHINTV